MRARARGAGRFVFLGDLVGYGPDPARVIELIRALGLSALLAERVERGA